MTTFLTTKTAGRSVLANLRSVAPTRVVSFREAKRIAEIQASKLLDVLGDGAPGEVPISLIANMPRIRIVGDAGLPNSGASYWDGQEWIIAINPEDSPLRQRLTIFHEYKHIIDHGTAHLLYTGTTTTSASRQAEQVADYFAGCVLVSRRMLKRAWGEGVQRVEELARLFGVSEPAIQVRLEQVGLVGRPGRCGAEPWNVVKQLTYQRGALTALALNEGSRYATS